MMMKAIKRGLSRHSSFMLALIVLETLAPGGIARKIMMGKHDSEAISLQNEAALQEALISTKIDQPCACLVSLKESESTTFSLLKGFLANKFCIKESSQLIVKIQRLIEVNTYVLRNDLQHNFPRFISHQPNCDRAPVADPFPLS